MNRWDRDEANDHVGGMSTMVAHIGGVDSSWLTKAGRTMGMSTSTAESAESSGR